MRRRAGRRGRIRLATGLGFAAALSFVAGMTDALGFLLAGDFVSFMSGNTTRLGIAAGEGAFGRALHLGALLAAFVAGNALGVLLMRWARGSQPVLLALVAGSTTLAGLLWPTDGASLVLVLSMGAINVALEEVGGQSLGLTYVTGALSRFGRGIARAILGEASPGWWVQIVPWCGMALGAVAGAVLVHHIGEGAVFASAAGSAGLALAALAIPRRWRRSYLVRRPYRRSRGQALKA
ncbi:YoaK family protein [Aureimonas sp. ME7]|uniref:YoaK family protein n=1 Tax=Aureimonas sp. ME7 TaxID=2744252 RepID=UPI0015F64CD4|nr:YoaK family protein [Aureimonas sp. ME7]